MLLTLPEITNLQANKTGALIRWSAMAGARLAKADSSGLKRYADNLGLAFQIADDILDIEGDMAKAGKRLQKDTEAGKATFVSILGLEAARQMANDLVEQAICGLDNFGHEAQALRQAARFVIDRDM
jgi:farnesyl diphosphate synthase